MTIACAPPDADLGIAIRLAGFLDCQARALGENGFQAIAGGPVAAELLSGVVTIFVALIGYRFILGGIPSTREGVSWAVRLGIALMLATGWPAFQVLLYRTTVDAPGEIAGVLLPSASLPTDGLDERVQAAYDTLRLGSGQEVADGRAGAAPIPAPTDGVPAIIPPTGRGASIGTSGYPQTAMMLVVATEGALGALRVAIGFLLAMGPLAAMTLLFDATLGFFSGWLRTLAGAALALTGATAVTALHVVVLESELARLQSYTRGGVPEVVDPQALTTIVLLFAMVMLVVVLLAIRAAGGLKLPLPNRTSRASEPTLQALVLAPAAAPAPIVAKAGANEAVAPPRAASIANALEADIRRERVRALATLTSAAGPSSQSTATALATNEQTSSTAPLGVSGRRFLQRRTLSATRRDRVS